MHQEITIRNIRKEDSLWILKIRNAEDVRRHFLNRRKVEVDEHRQWFAEQLKPESKKQFFVATRQGCVAGYMRYDLKNGAFHISVAVDNQFRRQGVGAQLLAVSLPLMISQRKPIIAEVKRYNVPSQRFFTERGFVLYKQTTRYLSLIYK